MYIYSVISMTTNNSFLPGRGIEIRALEQKIQVQVVRMPDSVKFITGSKSVQLNTMIISLAWSWFNFHIFVPYMDIFYN